MSPQVSIVMPIYNGQNYLVDAVASLVEQTFADWELICVDDGSTDRSAEIVDWLASQEDRIRVLHQENTGIVGALNHGCTVAQAPLICRMDCDDIALPDRIAKQYEFLQRNPDVLVVGSSILEMDSDGEPLAISRLPLKHAGIEANLLSRRTGHFHPTTMFRAEAFRDVGGYRRQYQWVEDHDLWLRMARVGKLANLSDCLLCYRQHAGSVCWQRSDQQRLLMNDLLQSAYKERGKKAPNEVFVDSTCQRSQAGSGKWARAAAKGGFTRSTLKHVKQLLYSDASTGYKLRMTAESLLRLPIAAVRRRIQGEWVEVPRFTIWQQHAKALLQAIEKQCPPLALENRRAA